VDGKSTLPPKEDVLKEVEQLIHHFMITTEGIDAPVGEVYFSAGTLKENSVFTSTARAVAFPTG